MQKKKKAAIKRQRPNNVTVVMMKEYSSTIPKGKVRQKLASNLSLRFTCTMSSQEIRNKIIHAFKVAKFVVLECDSTGHNLIKSADQSVDGEMVVAHKGGCVRSLTWYVSYLWRLVWV